MSIPRGSWHLGVCSTGGAKPTLRSTVVLRLKTIVFDPRSEGADSGKSSAMTAPIIAHDHAIVAVFAIVTAAAAIVELTRALDGADRFWLRRSQPRQTNLERASCKFPRIDCRSPCAADLNAIHLIARICGRPTLNTFCERNDNSHGHH